MSSTETRLALELPDRTATLNQLVQHWAKSRIDTPLQLLARYDEAGKQLVTIGTALQTLFTGLYFAGKLGTMSGTPAILIAGLLGLVVLLAGLAVCYVQLDTQILPAFELFKKCDLADDALWNALGDWCDKLHHSIQRKRRYLIFAKTCLIAGFAFLFYALSNAMHT
jgi:hypothetical protein